MTLSRNVRPNNFLARSNMVSIFAGLLLFLNFVAWSSANHGFHLGYDLAEEKAAAATVNQPTDIIFPRGEGTYKQMASEYFFLCWLVLSFLVMCLLRRFVRIDSLSLLLTLANLLLILIVTWKLRWLLSLKDPNMNESLDSPFNFLVRYSVFYDWLGILIAAALCIIELARLPFSFPKKNEKRMPMTKGISATRLWGRTFRRCSMTMRITGQALLSAGGMRHR